jgi:dTDP-4-dehydrorhamnose reductase
MRILVTGASGLLGLNLALEASQQHEVFGSVYENEILTRSFKVLQSDLTEPGALEKLVDTCDPEWVINCAALANLEACEANPALAKKLNSELPEKLANYVAKGGARLVHISTDAVFDGTRGNYTEEDKPNPLSVYARSKLDGEQAVQQANPDAVIARVNIYGWSLSGRRSLAEWFVNNLSAENSIMGFTDVYFCPLHVKHLAKILLLMLERELKGMYHVVSSECCSKFDFGRRLAGLFSLDESLIEPYSVSDSDLTAARSRNLTLKAAKLNNALGVNTPGIDTGLEEFFNEFEIGYPGFIQGMKV